MFNAGFFADRGALAGYGPDLYESGRQAARLVDKIIKGQSPATIPVEANSRIELVINLKVAKALGMHDRAGGSSARDADHRMTRTFRSRPWTAMTGATMCEYLGSASRGRGDRLGRAETAGALELGKPAPDFTLPDANGERVGLKQFRGKNLVLIEFFGAAFAPT